VTETLSHWWAAIAVRDAAWLCVGLTGQAMFSARWIVQWLVSERTGRSIMPEVFWYLSFVGGLLVLSYGIHRLDPVIILGQFGVLIYARNLFFIRKKRREPDCEAMARE
jgi:lipid-A-disaccharide synthase-like uncharacterized protein